MRQSAISLCCFPPSTLVPKLLFGNALAGNSSFLLCSYAKLSCVKRRSQTEFGNEAPGSAPTFRVFCRKNPKLTLGWIDHERSPCYPGERDRPVEAACVSARSGRAGPIPRRFHRPPSRPGHGRDGSGSYPRLLYRHSHLWPGEPLRLVLSAISHALDHAFL